MVRKRQDIFGNICWYNDDGEFHRDDGPAIEYASGEKEWYLDSVLYSEKEYKVKMRSKKLKDIL